MNNAFFPLRYDDSNIDDTHKANHKQQTIFEAKMRTQVFIFLKNGYTDDDDDVAGNTKKIFHRKKERKKNNSKRIFGNHIKYTNQKTVEKMKRARVLK